MAVNTIGGYEFLGNGLQSLLMADDIVPGSQPGYELCKQIYSYHPHGAKLVDFPIAMAQFKPRKILVQKAPGDGEALVEAFQQEWKAVQADRIIFSAARIARIYGISTLGIIVDGDKTDEELDFKKLYGARVGFNTWDPLNTAGALVLNQDPNAIDYQKVTGVSVNGIPYHRSRTCVLMNEDPLYIEYQSAGFGFNGRSVYQRGLTPLKSFVMTMATDMMVALKAGVIVAKMKSQSSAVDQVMRNVFGQKRQLVKEAKVGNVLSIDVEESIESLNFQNLEGPYALARRNIIENEAAACGTPAKIVLSETFAEGFGEGTEDAKAVAQFIETIRAWMHPLYAFMDEIVMYRAWNEDFYATLQNRYPDEYGSVSYTVAFNEWRNSFVAEWPDLLQEPESEKIKGEEVVLKAVLSVVEILMPTLDPDNKARVIEWMCDTLNEKKRLFTSPLEIDPEALASYTPPVPVAQPSEPRPESFSDSARETLDSLDKDIRQRAEEGIRLVHGKAATI